jgi:CxxC motif-containing protein (DUF1111 family)
MSQNFYYNMKGLRSICSLAIIFIAAAGMRASGQTLLNIQNGVQLAWPTSATNNIYQPQWSANPGGPWSNLSATFPGNGLTNWLYTQVPGGARYYQVLEIVPGAPAVALIPTNGGFESGSGTVASNWVVSLAAGGPVYAIRTNDNPRTGNFHFEVGLASTGAGPVVEFNQSGIPVTAGTTYPLTFYANAQSGSQGYNAQWRVLWNAGGDTGYHTYSPGNNTYALISNSVTAPAGATSATLFFHFAGAAVPSQSAVLQIDDVALTSGVGPGSPNQTNVLHVTGQPVTKIGWASISGIQYQPQATTNLASHNWTNVSPMMLGDGTAQSVMLPMSNSTAFFRLSIPPVVVQPPTGLETIASGNTNSIGLGWNASVTPGVTGYRILYGLSGGNVTNTMIVGNVNSAIISGLVSGQNYFLSVFALGPSGQSSPTAATLTAMPDTTAGIVPLFDAFTTLEPDTISNTPTALITWIADRPRARHARESEFMLYDTYLPFYWEQRMTTIQIIDTIAKGGSNVTFNMTSLNVLDTPNIRFFFQGQTTVAQYSDNLYAGQVDNTLTNWSTTINYNNTFNRKLQLGDRVEMEFSPFMLTVSNGQLNYYGGAILYVVGQGIVPWQEGVTNDAGSVNAALDSTPMPTNGWLAGTGTMPYQYSAESNHVFNQLAPNASPLTGEPFLLGRRLHHTDFGDGTHAEQPNPVFTNQIGKLGPKFVNRSCVACHNNNSRALPPAIGAPMLQSVVKVGSDAHGTPDPVLGSVLQSQATNGAAQDVPSISSYTTINGQYGDGTTYTLQKPNYTFSTYTPAFYSVRLAPQIVGMGLLEAVSESTIQGIASSNAANTNGITGTVRVVTDPQTGQPRVGRFTYRGGQAMVKHQIAAALNNDMGVTTSVFPIPNGATNAGPIELADSDLTNWVRYISSLGVNARRNLTSAQALQGEALFASASCTACHTATITTSPYHPIAELRNQTIHPYTDLLLHDMGPGLADNMGEGNATGSQWRTSPLWSIGLTPGESGGEAYLHDGRARTLAEAILWHGGEAAASQAAFVNMSATNRAALIAFLQSL